MFYFGGQGDLYTRIDTTLLLSILCLITYFNISINSVAPSGMSGAFSA